MNLGHVLIVDDEIQIREMLSRALQMEGYEVTTVPDADQGLDAAGKAVYDLILLDVQMGPHSGMWLLQELRNAHNKVPIIIFSGAITPELEQEARRAGANEVLPKGTRLSILLETIKQILSAGRKLFEPHEKLEKKTILLVDDQREIRMLLRRFFETKGFQVLDAESGEAALEVVKERIPSIALLDINLPQMDGIETLRRLKEMHPDIGVLMITGGQDDEKIHQSMELGAYGYILKPFDLVYLELVVMSKIAIIS